MKHVVEYKLHGGNIPYFIEDGGYFADGGKLIGLTKDDEYCYVPPDTELVTFHTKLALQDHIANLPLASINPDEGSKTLLSESDKRALAGSWWDERH